MRQKIKLFVTLLMLCLSTTAWAQYSYTLKLEPNYEGAESVSIPVEYGVSGYQYKLSNFVPTSSFGSDFIRDGHSIVGWSESPTGPVVYAPDATVTMTGNLTLYAVWDYGLLYTITSESPKTATLTGYLGNKPTGSLEIPASFTIGGNEYAVTSIGSEAFYFCTGLTSITIPASVTSIGEDAFFNCNGLTSVTIPASVTSIGGCVFENCSYLASINVDENNVNYVSDGGVLFNKDKTTLIRYPEGKSGTAYTIPASVTSIGDDAFKLCGALTSVTIPASVTSIGEYAFDYCAKLASVTVYATPVPTLGIYAFDDNKQDRKIYVFDNIKSDYMSATNWSNYASDIESIDDVTVSGVTANQNPAKTTDNWSTYYHPQANVKINTEDVKIFKASLSGSSLTLTEVTGNVIKAGQAVVLKAPASGELDMELTSSVATGNFSGNELKGTTTALSGAAGNIYVLNYKSGTGVGFYKLKSDGTLGANKAYLTYDGASPSNFFGLEEETTGVKSIDNGKLIIDNYYDLSGRKVANPKKGIYIHNGRKEVLK